MRWRRSSLSWPPRPPGPRTCCAGRARPRPSPSIPTPSNLAPTIAENHQVYEGLVDFDTRYEIEPALATSWRLADPLTWEFELRRGVTFHDGEPFTAEDVVFSLRRAASGASQFKDYVRPIASIEAAGDHAVRIRTTAPSPDLPTRLPFVFIMSERWAEQHGATTTAPSTTPRSLTSSGHADGTGPFRLESFEPGNGSMMTRNPAWWGLGQDPHSIDRIEHVVIADRSAASPTCSKAGSTSCTTRRSTSSTGSRPRRASRSSGRRSSAPSSSAWTRAARSCARPT